MPATLDNPRTAGEILAEEDSSAALDRPWLLVVYDDPVNTMAFVTEVFERVLSLARPEAERKMWEVHTKGRSVVWEGTRERAEVFMQQLHLYGLQAKLERAEG